MLLSVPCQGLVIASYFKAQVKRLALTDQRVKLTNEMVQGIRVIKMCALVNCAQNSAIILLQCPIL